MTSWWSDDALIEEKRAKIQEVLDEVLDGYMVDTWVMCFHGVETEDLHPGGGHLINDGGAVIKVIGMLETTKMQLLGDQIRGVAPE